ncbi:D-sedoheptulose-7-phosphate isomerase [Rugosimonospora africana]|uniref:Phosphoheptose isomerase n=1 Tax=Rugosimonospora africana TaxID=556532 RepID=A0A8J3QPX2_9ACTN|nr:SIS domain-containing protein [Rugosimonospora africana]GIH14774.1 phosphoheptose isomerase [Rugosimonospora africana]
MRTPDLASAARERFAQRVGPAESLAADADLLVRAARAMADRFHRGGTLIAFGNGAAGTDAHHVAVEFMHPVIIGKPALPAVSLTADVASLTALAGRPGLPDVFAHQIRTLARPADIALGISADGGCVNVLRGLREGARLGLLTVALFGGAGGGGAGAGGVGVGTGGVGTGGAIGSSPEADHVLLARSGDPRVVKEVHVTAYHLLWELVHVFLELRGLPVPQAGSTGRVDPAGSGVLVAGRRP